MKKLSKILLTLMLLSSANLFSEFTNIHFNDLFTPLYANQQSNESEFLILKNKNTETSIFLRKDSSIKINRKMKKYIFHSFNPTTNLITIESKKDGVISISIDQLEYISVRIDELRNDNVLGGMTGTFLGAGIGAYPSALLGWIVGITMESVSQNYTMAPGLTCMGITATGTALSAKLGYDIGKNIGNPYIQIPMSGAYAWEITVE